MTDDWRPRAACIGAPDTVMFPTRPAGDNRRIDLYAPARALCRSCPVVTFTAPCPCGTDVDWHATVTPAGAHTSEPGVCGCETVVNGGGLSDGGGKLGDVTKPRRTAIQPGPLTPTERG